MTNMSIFRTDVSEVRNPLEVATSKVQELIPPVCNMAKIKKNTTGSENDEYGNLVRSLQDCVSRMEALQNETTSDITPDNTSMFMRR